MKCRECGSEEFRKHGYRKVGEHKIQRYKCKKCKKTISEHSTTYTINEKRLLSFLVNFLENDLRKADLKKSEVKSLLSKSKTYKPGISDIKIKPCRKPECFDFRSQGITIPIPYSKPKLIICEDAGNIKLVKIPQDIAEKCKNGFQLHFK